MKLEKIEEFDPLTGDLIKDLNVIKVYANSHYITPKPTIEQAIIKIKKELEITLEKHKSENKLLEAQRLEERTRFDLEMIEATGTCAGIENYSRFLTGRKPGEPPPTLFEYFPDNIIRDLMNSVELDLIAMGMKGMEEAVVSRVIENLPQKKQAMFEPIEGAVSKREVDNARKGIVQAAKQMEKDGAFNLEDYVGGGEMVE